VKPVSDLYGKHEGADIFVVGTGASMRVFPRSFWADRITIGLNYAWRIAPVRYSLTIGPHLHVPEFVEGEEPRPEITWITKFSKAKLVLTPEQLQYADRHFYSYESNGRKNTQPQEEPSDAGRILDWVRRPSENNLYQWSSISQTGANLAANLGARNVILVGCDNCALLDDHHADRQHTKWLGAEPERRYLQYYEGLVEVRAALRERGVNLLSLSSLLKLDEPERDFRLLCDELEQPHRVGSTVDISAVDNASVWRRPSNGGLGARIRQRLRRLTGARLRR
jgi:hypothetical protein